MVFFVSTVGFTDIAVSFDTRHSNTSSRFVRFDWSSNGGGTWNNGNVFEATSGGDTWYNGRASGLLPAAASNNAAFAFRMVQVFAPGTSAAPATSTSTYAGSGTLRWDVTVTGITPAPQIGLAGLAAASPPRICGQFPSTRCQSTRPTWGRPRAFLCRVIRHPAA